MKKLVSVAIAATALFTVGSASAVTISFSDSFANVTTELQNETLTLDLFDDMGGTRTLNSVMVSVTGNVDADGTLTNNNAGNSSFQFTETAEIFEGTATGPASLETLNVFPTFGGTIIGQQQYLNVPAGGTVAFGPHSISGADSFIVNTPADVAAFVGPGSFSYDFNTLIGTAFAGGGGNIATNVLTNAGATLTVTYDFDEVIVPVPAPAGIALFALGLLGMRRLRK